MINKPGDSRPSCHGMKNTGISRTSQADVHDSILVRIASEAKTIDSVKKKKVGQNSLS
jgi:hypothetical protein